MWKSFIGLFHTKVTMASLSVISILLEYLLPKRLVTDNDTDRDPQSRLSVAVITMNESFGGKIMISGDDEQLVILAGDGTHDWGNVIVLSFKGDACRARLIKEIEEFVRNKELYRVVARYLSLRLYRDGIADGVEGDGKGDDDERNDHRAGLHKGWRHLPDDVAHLLTPQFYVVYVILVVVHISKSLLQLFQGQCFTYLHLKAATVADYSGCSSTVRLPMISVSFLVPTGS